MDTQNIPKRLVMSIEAYRAAKKAGKITIIPTTDSYGNVIIATEQTIQDPFTGEQSVNVVANITSKNIAEGIERTKKLRDEGNPDNAQDMGVQALRKNAEISRKQADEYEARAKEREASYADRIADMEAWLHDAEAVEAESKKRYEEELSSYAQSLAPVVDELTETKKKSK